MLPRSNLTVDKALAALRAPRSLTQATDTIHQLLATYSSQLVDMPPTERAQVFDALTSPVYANLFEDVDIALVPGDSPLTELHRAIGHILPATHITTMHDCETAAIRIFQRLMERRATLGWQIVHPRIEPQTAPLTKELVQSAFELQNALGRTTHGVYPVIFSLDYPVVCSMQNLYIGSSHELCRQTFVSVVKSGFLRLTVMPWYMFGYDGYDGLVWSQKGFRVRVGGFRLPLQAIALYDLACYLTDYRLERCIAYNPETGAVVKHNARVLTH